MQIQSLNHVIKNQAKRLIAVLIIVCLFGLNYRPALSTAKRQILSSSFSFTHLSIPELATSLPQKRVRAVHPSLQRYSAWVSLVGASIALYDLDGDGLSNDICYVDTRTDRVIVTPAPGTSPRYEPFSLKPTQVPYNSHVMAPTGCLPGDLNEDGLTDIVVYYWGRAPIAFLRQERRSPTEPILTGDRYIQQEIVSEAKRWYTNTAIFTDLDGDGHNDLILGNYFPDGAEILNPEGTGQEVMNESFSYAKNGGQNHVFLWVDATVGKQPSVKLQEVTEVFENLLPHSWTHAVGAADLDGDLLPEIYFANDFGPDRLLHNHSKPGALNFSLLEGKPSWLTPKSLVVGRDSFPSMGVDFGDLNQDGLLDIYVSNIAQYELPTSHFLFENTGQIEQMNLGIAPFEDKAESLGLSRGGWAWDAKLADFNNDGNLEALQATGWIKGQVNGWPEVQELAMMNDQITSNPALGHLLQPDIDVAGHQHNPFYAQADNGQYYDIAKDLGLDEPQVSRGIAIADVDRDGDLDFAVANQWESANFYRNENPTNGSFLGLDLLLPINSVAKSQINLGRPAIGASATVGLPNGKQLVAQVDGGNGHSGIRSPQLHFGLGQIEHDSQLSVDLHWRDSHGKPHQQSLVLSPGWHRILLDEFAVVNN